MCITSLPWETDLICWFFSRTTLSPLYSLELPYASNWFLAPPWYALLVLLDLALCWTFFIFYMMLSLNWSLNCIDFSSWYSFTVCLKDGNYSRLFLEEKKLLWLSFTGPLVPPLLPTLSLLSLEVAESFAPFLWFWLLPSVMFRLTLALLLPGIRLLVISKDPLSIEALWLESIPLPPLTNFLFWIY